MTDTYEQYGEAWKQAIKRLTKDEIIRVFVHGIAEKDARIKELEDALDAVLDFSFLTKEQKKAIMNLVGLLKNKSRKRSKNMVLNSKNIRSEG